MFIVPSPLARLRQIPAPEETISALPAEILPEIDTETIFVAVSGKNGIHRLPLHSVRQMASVGAIDTNDGTDPVVRLNNLLRRFEAAEAADAAVSDVVVLNIVKAEEADLLARAEAALAAARARA